MKANLIEMEGFLRGKCLPGDMKVNETNAQYLVRKFAESEAKCASLAAENAGLKELIEQHAGSIAVCPNCSHEEPSETDDIVALYRSMETQATDSFLAEVRAQGVDALVERRLTAARLAKEAGHEITARDLEGEAIRARFFAMEIRKGVQS